MAKKKKPKTNGAAHPERPPKFVDAPNCTGVLLVCPAYGQMMTAHSASLFYQIAQILTASGIPNTFIWFSMADIIECRNVFLTLWWDSHPTFSHMLMIDSDMNVTPLCIRDMLMFDKPLTGVFYSKRENLPKDGNPGSIIIGHPLDTQKITVENGFMQCRHVGGGIVLVKREVVREMLKRNPGLSDISELGSLAKCGVTRVIRAFEKMRDPTNGNQLSEDYAFCQRWLDCGGEVWANVHYQINHIGPTNYPMTYSSYLKKIDDPKEWEALPNGPVVNPSDPNAPWIRSTDSHDHLTQNQAP